MIRNVLSIILATICLAGCTMTPSYKRPDPPIPAEWPTGPAYKGAVGEAGPAAVEIGWREFYVDEKLQKVIALTLNNNRDLRIAVLNIEKANYCLR